MVSTRTLGQITIASAGYNMLVTFALHFLQPEFNPLKAPMSAYVLGGYGALVTTIYFVNCAGLLAVSYGLVTTLPLTRLTRIAFALALIACAGILVAASFPMDYPPPPKTTSGRLHALGGALTFPSKALASILFSLSMRRDGNWKRISAVASALSVGIVAAFVLGVSSIIILGFGGYAQRILMALFSGWLIVVGLHLTRIPRVT